MNRIVLVLYLTAIASNAIAQGYSDTVYTEVDQMPFFHGCVNEVFDLELKRRCSNQELYNFISKNLEYPQIALDSGITGTVIVSFIINEFGRVTHSEIVKDIGGGCGQAALHLVNEMPVWEPAIYEGKRVKMRLNLPVSFNLKNTGKEPSEAYTLTWGSLNGAEITRSELQSSLDTPLIVRNVKGESMPVDEWSITCGKGKRENQAKNRGKISLETKKMLQKLRPGTILTITASVQEKGKFEMISRSFLLVKEHPGK